MPTAPAAAHAPSVARLAWRQTLRDFRAGELRLLLVAVTLAVAALTAVGFFADRLERGLARDARQMLGGDAIIASDQPPPQAFVDEARARALSVAHTASFPSMGRATEAQGGASRLVAVKAVSEAYPLRGRLKLQNDAGAKVLDAAGAPEPGTVWVDAGLLDALQLKVGDALVTGATGGVGSIAVALLARRGYRVVAATGKSAEGDYLRALGATEILDRKMLSEPGKPMQKERWGSVIDSVGSHTLANACAQTASEGVVAACGLAQGMDFPVTVAPFILRGVTLRGVNSVFAPRERREEAWRLLARALDPAMLESMVTEIGLADAITRAPDVLAGKIRGRLVVDVNR